MIEAISYLSQGKSIHAELYKPVPPASGGVVVIAHGSDGMAAPWGAMIRKQAADLAAKSFTVLVPYYFGSADGSSPSPAEVLSHLATWERTLADCIAFAGRLPGGSAGRIGLLGFSLGGFLSLRLRSSAKALVEYFAPDSELGGIGAATRATGCVQIHHGEKDSIVPVSRAINIQRKLKAEYSCTDLNRYPNAGHGFSGSQPGDAVALRDSSERTVRYFLSHL